MKAARVHAPNDLRIEETARPTIKHDDDVAIRIHACGICPSDVRSYTGLRGGRTFPYTPGLEWAGEVVGVGAGVVIAAVGGGVRRRSELRSTSLRVAVESASSGCTRTCRRSIRARQCARS